jgi:pSer/pThr/pTyr-binding forkhead associated (FHA) protein
MPFLVPLRRGRPLSPISFDKLEFVLGRSAESDVEVHESTVSRRHAKIEEVSAGHWQVCDLDSSHGTSVNGSDIQRVTLRQGDLIRLAGVASFLFFDEFDADLLEDRVTTLAPLFEGEKAAWLTGTPSAPRPSA